MITHCSKCNKYYDDVYRDTECDHATFLANDGQNNFKYYPESWYADKRPDQGEAIKYYFEFLEKNKIVVDKE